MSELKHAAMPEAPDYALIGFDLLDIGFNMIGFNMIGKDIEDRERYINACADAAKLCFEVDNLKTSMMKLYKELEGMEE